MDGVYITAIIIAACIITFAVIYIMANLGKKGGNCSRLKSPEALQNITRDDARYENPLRDFHIKGSYNSCASGAYRNDWVDLCALSHAIKSGCRLLDFEIYDLGGVPVVGVSDTDTFTVKHSYNSIPLDQVLRRIENEAFGGDINGADPLFLNFRIKSDHAEICDAVATALLNDRNATLASRLLSSKYSYQFHGKNLGTVPVKELVQKVIVMASENPRIASSKLAEFINLAPSPVFRVLSFRELASQDLGELTTFSQQKLLMITPSSHENYTSASAITLGAQFMAMSMQTKDTNLEAYNNFFKERGNCAFSLKDEPYKQEEATEALPLGDEYTAGTYKIETDHITVPV